MDVLIGNAPAHCNNDVVSPAMTSCSGISDPMLYLSQQTAVTFKKNEESLQNMAYCQVVQSKGSSQYMNAKP